MKRKSFFFNRTFSKTALRTATVVSFLFASALAPVPASALSKGPPKTTQTAQETASKPTSSAGNDLDMVVAKLNQSATTFKSAQGDFTFETYQKLVDEKEQQSGRIFFRRTKNGVDAAFEIASPAPKQVVYKDGKVFIYEKKINQVTERDVSKNKADVDAFLSLGFGASGNDLLRDYEVTMEGWETVDGTKTAKLDLTPKNQKMRQTYNKIILWIDPERAVLLRQQFFESSGDYRLAHYTNLKLNGKISDDDFKLKTNGNTKTVRPQ